MAAIVAETNNLEGRHSRLSLQEDIITRLSQISREKGSEEKDLLYFTNIPETFHKMTEMHLDLCIQSTTHLLETLASIKENVRMLEVFLNSGLQLVDSGDSSSIRLPNENYINKDFDYSSLDSKFYQYLNNTSNNINRHMNCCCMCRFRSSIQSSKQRTMNGTISRASVATTTSNSSNTNSSKKKTHITPRLNKTASLRRAKILQKISSLRN